MRALVTGGTGRVGSAIVRRLGASGWDVVAAGRADGDLSRAAAARELVERTAKRLGGLELLVHAADDGFAPRAVEDVSEEDWDRAVGATAKGAFFTAQAAAPHLRASHGNCDPSGARLHVDVDRSFVDIQHRLERHVGEFRFKVAFVLPP